MKRILIILAVLPMALMGAAQAVTITNADFEDAYTLNLSGAAGNYALGAAGWSYTGNAGTIDPDDTISGNVYATSSDPYGRVGWVNANSSLSQTLGTVIATNTDYTLSALFGNRNGLSFGGTFGFYAGNASNIIGTTSLTDPGNGLWSSQSYTLDAAFLANFVGQQLGIIFFGTGTQFHFDDVAIAETVVPLPAAIWLFGSALLGGGLIKRRRKKSV